MSEFDINNVTKIAGYLDLGRTLAPAITDEKYLKLLDACERYQCWKHRWGKEKGTCEFYDLVRLMEEILKDYDEFCTGIIEAISRRCKEINNGKE